MTQAVRLWPVSLQRPLLRAAFLSGDAARSAWAEWRTAVDLDAHPDPGSFRLLSRVCRNLRQLGVDDPVLAKLAGIARQSWFKNQSAFGACAPHFGSLHSIGIDVVMLGSMAMALRCPDYALEPRPRWSWLVRPEHAVTAIRQLRASGWKATTPPPDALLPAFVAHGSAQSFVGTDGQRLDLAWQWLPGHADDETWLRAERREAHHAPVFLLAPADHVLAVCAGGRPPTATPLFWRAIDVLLLADGVDWGQLVAEARRRRLEACVAETLRYVQDALDAPLPRDVLARLDAAPVDAPLAPTARPTIRHELARLWASQRAHCSGLGLGRRLLYFPRYLQYAWRLEHLRQVPRRAFASTRYLLRTP